MKRYIGTIVGSYVPGTRHYVGREAQLLPPAAELVIEETAAGVLLYRYAADGEFAGDTWHQSVEEAKNQAGFEFSGASIEWSEPAP